MGFFVSALLVVGATAACGVVWIIFEGAAEHRYMKRQHRLRDPE